MPVFEDDPFGGVKEPKANPAPKPREVNFFHSRSDRDESTFSQHHTLGISHTQASPGDHNHDGKSSRKIGEGLGIVISGSKAGNAALASLISALAQVFQFTDNTT